MSKRIFFFVKSYFRERQWDTVKNVPEGYEAFYLQKERLQGSVKNVKKAKSFLGQLKVKFSLRVPLLNTKQVPSIANKCDFIYTWGYLPFRAKKPFVIEMDNPYCLTYYNPKAFRIYKKFLEKFLEKAYKLTFMSEASMHHFLHEFDGKFKEKSLVFYPFSERRDTKIMEKKGKEINFLFIGLTFRNKGGLELLSAFTDVLLPNIRLYVISFVPENIKQKFQKDKRIIFLDPMPRDKLLSKVYPQMDVFILPTLYESFGVVLLESLSFGLGLIATNVYAVPEMLYDGENGILLHHPFLKPESYYGKSIVNPVEFHLHDFNNLYLKEDFFYYSLYAELKEAIKQATEEHNKWRKRSIEIYKEKFSTDVWHRRFREIFS